MSKQQAEIIAKQQQEIIQYQQLAEQRLHALQAIEHSTFWRLTSPLRWGVIRFRYLRQAFAAEGVSPTIKKLVQALYLRIRPEESRLKFQLSAKPVVSVIIPVFNHYHETFQCLTSLANTSSSIAYEIIIVNDASTDETNSKLKKIAGIKVHNNEANSGFIASCNAGAKLAKGEYIVLLNNDTEVEADWLEALLRVFDSHHDAGLVGAKLIYPDQTLQEAGGIIFSDASGWNYGRGGHPDDPRFNYVREVDYCSGACIMVPTELFSELGGFNELYQPAYYEDTDLAFNMRAHGKRVYYQPQAQIIHYEGVSSGTDLNSGVKRYQVVNQQKFAARWADALSQQQSSDSIDAELAKQRNVDKTILIIDACTPTPDQDSGSVRMINIFKVLLNMGCKVVFFAENLARPEPYTQDLQQLGVEVWYYPFIPADKVAFFASYGHYFDAVMVSRFYIAENYIDLIRTHCPNAQLWFDTVDLHYLREQRLAELEQDDAIRDKAEKIKQKELAVMAKSDISFVVSPIEQTLLATDAPQSQVEILSNIHQVAGSERGFSERQHMMFVGGFMHLPNIDAVQWFVADIWPLIIKQHPEMIFYVIGSNVPDEIKALANNNIIVTGYVPDIKPYLNECRLSVAPLRYGAGVKGKINTSMSYGLPVVATPVAVEGMGLDNGINVSVAESPQDFAKAVLTLYNDETLWNTLSTNALENIEAHFSFAAARRVLEKQLYP